MIHAQQLSKSFGDHIALQDITLTIPPGQIFGLFGSNGAGKSTFVRLLATLLAPTKGTATINGHDIRHQPQQVRAAIGLVTANERSFYGRVTTRHNLRFYAAMQNIPRRQIAARVDTVLDLFGLTPKATTPVQSLSTGQMQRLNIARALIHDPPVLFLDEPTKSMDVQTSDFVKELIKNELVGRQGKTVLFISHELYEMDHFCDQILILNHGRQRAFGTPAALKAQLPQQATFRLTVSAASPALHTSWQQQPTITAIDTVSHTPHQTTYDLTLTHPDAWPQVMTSIHQHGGRLDSYARRQDTSLRHIVAHFSQTETTP